MNQEIQLFNRDMAGGDEIVRAVGLISNAVTFDKWEPLLPLGIRDVTAIIGAEPVRMLSKFYMAQELPDSRRGFDASMTIPLRHLQSAVAYFTWLKIIPTLDAQHDGNGRSRRLGENEKGLTALQEYKDEQNILRLAYEAVDLLVEDLDRAGYPWWTGSERFRMRGGLLIRSKEEFDRYYHIGSHRLFVTLLPIMREAQETHVAPVLGKYLGTLLSDTEEPADVRVRSMLGAPARRAVALLTMRIAVTRLPVEVIPEGVVQIQQSQPVNSRLRAEQSARKAVADSLGDDARRILESMQATVAALDGDDTQDKGYISGPIVHSRGMSF